MGANSAGAAPPVRRRRGATAAAVTPPAPLPGGADTPPPPPPSRCASVPTSARETHATPSGHAHSTAAAATATGTPPSTAAAPCPEVVLVVDANCNATRSNAAHSPALLRAYAHIHQPTRKPTPRMTGPHIGSPSSHARSSQRVTIACPPVPPYTATNRRQCTPPQHSRRGTRTSCSTATMFTPSRPQCAALATATASATAAAASCGDVSPFAPP